MVMDLLKIITFLHAIFIQKFNIIFQPYKVDAMLVSLVSSVLWNIITLPARLECSFWQNEIFQCSVDEICTCQTLCSTRLYECFPDCVRLAMVDEIVIIW
jgi:hypothetical protein